MGTFEMTIIDLIMITSATWYITFCLVHLPGPLDIFKYLRGWFHIMTCIYCLSLWIGLVFYAFVYVGYTDIVYVFGIVGAGHLFASWTGANYAPLPPYQGE